MRKKSCYSLPQSSAFHYNLVERPGKYTMLSLFSAMLVVCSASCIANEEPATGPSQSVSSVCRSDLFVQSFEHITVEHPTTFIVLSVEGQITSIVGEWPAEIVPRLELVDPSKTGRSWSILSDADGGFSVPDVPPGKYCFKASAPGWQSIIGFVILDSAAKGNTTMKLRLPLDV